MYPVSGSPISKDSLRGLSRQRSAISTHNTESILSWSAFFGWSILPASRHHPAISSQPSAWKPCAAASATRAQSSLRKVFLRSGLYFGPASRPKNPESSDGRARAGKTSIRYSPLVANRACSGSLKVAPSALRKHQIGEELENIPSLPRLAGCTPPPSQPAREAARWMS